MAFIGSKITEIQKKEEKTELTIALNKLGDCKDNLLFNNVLEVLKKYCDNNTQVYILNDKGIYKTIHDYDEDYLIIFSNEYLADKWNKGMFVVEKISFTKIVEKLFHDYKTINGINIDRATSGLLIETPKLLEKIFGIRDIYQLNIKDWGKGVPEYESNQLMNSEMLLDFGIQVVHDYLIKDGYSILHGANRLDSNPNIIAIKDNNLVFITVDSAVAPKCPSLDLNRKSIVLEIARRYHANAYYAPVSFGSTDSERYARSIALQGDSYYANYKGLVKIESQYS